MNKNEKNTERPVKAERVIIRNRYDYYVTASNRTAGTVTYTPGRENAKVFSGTYARKYWPVSFIVGA